MRRLLAATLGALILSAGLLPAAAQAGSCRCLVDYLSFFDCYTKVLDADTCPVVLQSKNAAWAIENQQHQEELLWLNSAHHYKSCTYVPTDYCPDPGGGNGMRTKYDGSIYGTQIMCGPPGQQQLCTRVDVSCTTDNDCAGLGGGDKLGPHACHNGSCFLSDTRFRVYQQEPSLLGIKADLKLQQPLLEIHIPGLHFTDLQNTLDNEGNLHIPYIPEYLAALYKFGMAVASILAVVMIIARGFDIAISPGGENKAEKLKRIGEILIGLLLVWGSYFILYSFNPDLVSFRVLKVRYLKPIPLENYNKKPDDNPEGGQLTGLSPFTTVEIDKYAHQGCGKNLPQIALGYANQMICQGPIHCANFVSRVLLNSGCDSSYTDNSAGSLAQILIKKGWKLVKGHQGVSAGDIIFWGTDTPGNHVGIATDGNGGYIDSTGSNIALCWPSSVTEKIKSVCGDFKDPSVYPNDDDTPAGVQKKEAFSQCVANNSGCSPNAKLRQESCGYCAKIGPVDEFLSIAQKHYPAPSHQCIAAKTIPFDQAKWAFYVINPNK